MTARWNYSDERSETMKRLFKIEAYGWGIFYRYAKTAAAARQRMVYAIFGKGYDGWEHEYWTITEVVK